MLESSLKSGCPGLVGQLMSGEYIKMLSHIKCWHYLVGIKLMSVISGCDAGDEVGRLKLQDTFTERTAALIKSVINEDFDDANILLQQGADINEIGEHGITPLLWVLVVTQDIAPLEYLLQNNANPNYRGYMDGFSPMYLASGGNREDILKLFLKYGGDVNLEGIGEPGDTLRESMLMVAISNFKEENIRILLEHGADINWNADGSMGIKNAPRAAIVMGRFDWALDFLKKGYRGDLSQLAKSVASIKVSEDGKADKQKVIDYLESKGITVEYWN